MTEDTVTITISREAAQDLAANVVDAKPSTIIQFAGSCRAYFNIEAMGALKEDQ